MVCCFKMRTLRYYFVARVFCLFVCFAVVCFYWIYNDNDFMLYMLLIILWDTFC